MGCVDLNQFDLPFLGQIGWNGGGTYKLSCQVQTAGTLPQNHQNYSDMSDSEVGSHDFFTQVSCWEVLSGSCVS